jgi:hypothetical protein
VVRNSPAAVAWPGGVIAVFARQASGALGFAIQAPGAGGAGAWGAWTAIGGHVLGSPAAWVNAGGVPEVAILNQQLQVAVSTYSAGTWAAWAGLGGGF